MNEELAIALKKLARGELGFDLVGITRAAPLPGGQRLDQWLAMGAHGEMGYMAVAPETRKNPALLLPGAASVICVALSYHDRHQPPEDALRSDRVVVARYARRKDYHRVVRRRLVRLGSFLRRLVPPTAFRTAVDTTPVLERELAWHAGLGWIGKNTCLINRQLGSELFLGELVTTLDLPPDPPTTSHCGTCTACLDACPTGALLDGGLLDARRCLSYLTIEHPSALPGRLEPLLGAHLAGCDICQAVCPWNRHAPAGCSPTLAPRAELDQLSLTQLHALDAAGWRTLTAGTPLRRVDFARFRRNLAAVEANLSRVALPRPPALAAGPHG